MKPLLLSALLLTVAAVPAAAQERPLDTLLSRLQARPWLAPGTQPEFAGLRGRAAAVSRRLISQFPGRMEPAQVASITLLGALARPEALPFLLRLARGRTESLVLRRPAVLALAGFPDRRVVLPLLDTLEDGSPALKLAAVRALERWTADRYVTGRMARLMRHADPTVRRHTLLLLARRRDAGSAQLIRRAFTDATPAVRAGAYRAAGVRRLEGALSTLSAAVGQGTQAERIAAVQGLAGFGAAAARAVDALLRILADQRADPYLRATVPGALVAIGEPAPRLRQALAARRQDPSPMIRRASTLALAALQKKGATR